LLPAANILAFTGTSPLIPPLSRHFFLRAAYMA
jgi:hypothetical protein